MKKIRKKLALAMILVNFLSCDKKENLATDSNPCAKGKFLYPWCGDDEGQTAIIQVLDQAIGSEFRVQGKTYQNAILASPSKELFGASSWKWSSQRNNTDSVLYFRYKKGIDFGLRCDICCAPKFEFTITSFPMNPCDKLNTP